MSSEAQVSLKEKIKEEFFKCSQDPVYFMERYHRVIAKAVSEKRKKSKDQYYENHHIIPSCIGGNNQKDNLVLLTAKEHFYCHYLLHKSFPDSKKLFYCFHKMIRVNKKHSRYTPSLEILSYIKQKHAQWVSEYFSIPIDEYSLEGKFVRTWNSALLVEKELGISHSNIGSVIKGKRKVAGGRIWKKHGEPLQKSDIELRKNTRVPKSIVQYDPITKKEIARYRSSYEASKVLKIPNSNIIKVCKGNIKNTKGLYFKYE